MHQTAYEFGLLGICQIVNSFAAFGDGSSTFHFLQSVRASAIYEPYVSMHDQWGPSRMMLHACVQTCTNRKIWMESHLKEYVDDGPFSRIH